MPSPKRERLLVPDSEIIVVLDTAPARELAYDDAPPSWVTTFAQMAQDGYSFSLADGAIAELLAQRHRDALSAAQCLRIVERLTPVLNPKLPVLLGKRDLGGMLHFSKTPLDEREAFDLSQLGWEKFKRCTDPANNQESPEWALQEERDEWIGFFAGWQEVLDEINAEATSEPLEPLDLQLLTIPMLDLMAQAQDQRAYSTPPLSTRNHLKNRYFWRQFVRKQKSKGAYDPTSPKKRNDGIDADLFGYLTLPAFVVTRDKGFFEGLADIQSFQKAWLYRPEALASAWLNGSKPIPSWR